MLRIHTLGVSLIAIAATAGSATAADLYQDYSPPPAAVLSPTSAYDWGGAYAGGLIGYGWGSATTPGDSFDVDGITGGVFMGMNAQLGPAWVVGVEGDIQATGMKDTVGTAEVKNTWNGTLRARAGLALNNVLLYGTGGLAVGRLKLEDGGLSEANTRLGYTLGAGVEAGLAGDVIGRAEYRYTDLGSDTHLGVPVDCTSSQALVGLGVKF